MIANEKYYKNDKIFTSHPNMSNLPHAFLVEQITYFTIYYNPT